VDALRGFVLSFNEEGSTLAHDGFDRITIDPKKMGGVPCLRGLRIPVATVVGLTADGMTAAEILRAYPDLEPQDIAQALRFAAYLTKEREIPLTTAS
jgi:uncharacterized protein (DUF433 family)